MPKQLVALFSAMLITGLIAMSMVVVGVSAMTNQNGTAVSNSPAAQSTAVSSTSASSTDQAAQIAQLQAEVAQYQAREQQYQAALDSDNQQLAQAASTLQTVQQLLAYLQNQGVISINNQGQIYVNGR
jgi:uncharacterized protein YlxW (UPF0749 family)